MRLSLMNLGSSTEDSVTLFLRIYNGSSQRIYTDSVTIRNWLPGTTRDTSFHDFVPQQAQVSFRFVAYTSLASDQNRTNDTLTTTVSSKYLSDSKATNVVFPPPDTVLDRRVSFQPACTFQTVGVEDMYDMPIRVEIHQCSDGTVVFRADTIADALYSDSGARVFRFPSSQGSYNVQNLKPGCYRIVFIARQSDDGDRSNDSASAEFSIRDVAAPDRGNDVALTRIYEPGTLQRVLLSKSIQPRVSIYNYGPNDESPVAVVGMVRDQSGTIVYRDTVIVPLISAQTSADVTFRTYQPTVLGMIYTFIAYSVAPLDTNRWNDTSRVQFLTRAYQDESVSTILVPSAGSIIPHGADVRPQIVCGIVTGVKPSAPVQLTAIVYHNGAIVRSSSYSVDASYFDSAAVYYTFPYSLAHMIAGLDTGQYSMCVAGNFHDDNPNNDSAWTSFRINRAHDLRADSINCGDLLGRLRVGVAAPVHALFTSLGMLNETAVIVHLTVRLNDSAEVYRDSTTVALWNAGTTVTLPFKDLTITVPGTYILQAIVSAADDELPFNDTVRRTLSGRYSYDVSADTLMLNFPSDSIPYRSDLHIMGVFSHHGIEVSQQYAVRAEMRSCSSGSLAFRVDTVVTELNPLVMSDTMNFPSSQVVYSTRTLAPGCYRLAVIAHDGFDGNRSNDTVYQEITIVSPTSVPDASAPTVFSLDAPFPNPCDGELTVRYTLAARASVQFSVRDMLGRVVFAHTDESVPAGEQRRTLTLPPLSDGSYVLTVSARQTSGIVHTEARTISVVHASAR
ncbi:MAG: T9SS type A sorting domain-containing protein [Bacteroidetes bacterium]|nr:T9SS type A sorting domain-containing protein [Bacteroidota bacterium]